MINSFPISSELREPLLYLECALFFILLEIGIIFLQKYFSKSKDVRNSTEIAYGLFFLFYSVNWLIRIFCDYFLIDTELRTSLIEIGPLLEIFGIFFFTFSIEGQKKFIQPYIFTILILILLILTLLNSITLKIPSILFSIPTWLIFLCFTLNYLFYFDTQMKSKGYNRTVSKYISLGFIIFFLGLTISAQFFTDLFGLEFRLFGAILKISSISLIFLCVKSQPPFAEFDWKDKLLSLFLMENSGLSLYTKHFKDDLKEVNPMILGGTLVGLHMMFKATINEKGFSIIKRPDYTVIIYSGEKITGILFSEKNLNSLKYLLEKLISQIEKIYRNVLNRKDWMKDLTVFNPIERIFMDIFQ